MYGVSASVSARNDIIDLYGKFITQVGVYAEKGARIMMANDWLEEPPRVVDRDRLARYKH